MIDKELLTIITLVAIGTFTLRVSGILVSNQLKRIKNIDIFFESIPLTLLISLIIPSILKEGLIGIVSSFLVIICMYRSKNILLSMILGVVVIALYRNI